MTIEKILVVDDELILRNFLQEVLRRKGLDVDTAENGKKALSQLKENNYDLVFTDMKLPDITGNDIIREGKELCPGTIFVVITAFGSIENAVESMRLGAYNYLIKPFTPDTIEAVIEKAKEHRFLLAENQYLRDQVSPGIQGHKQQIVAQSPAMKAIMNDVDRAAKSHANIFITGESGTGKEVIAGLIHKQSTRTDRPFIKVNCAAVPETLVESEFFGHEKGAFTGANAKRLGRFELANSGTLLLDEITEVPVTVQAKLLRAIQEQEFERIGGNKAIHVDVRIISTSNRNVHEAIAASLLREDLYYRLNVVPIHLPPLRDRPEDIIPLAEHFIQKFCVESHLQKKTLSPNAKQKLMNYEWPGNVRELANIIERAVVMDPSETVSAQAIYLSDAFTTPKQLSEESADRALPIGITLKELEKRLIIETLEAQNYNRTKTAAILDISVRTLRNKLNEYKKEGHSDSR